MIVSHDRTRRWRHHICLAAVSICIYVLIHQFVSSESLFDEVSLVTAYVCLTMMVAALSIGPVRVIMGGRPVTNHYLRRDLGIWTAVSGLVHLVIATDLSMSAEYIEKYVEISTSALHANQREVLFLWGSITAYISGLLLLLLLSLSNNRVMNLLKAVWWKRLQRSAYIVFVLTIVHGLTFQLLESRNQIFVLILLALGLSLFALQITAMVLYSRIKEANR